MGEDEQRSADALADRLIPLPGWLAIVLVTSTSAAVLVLEILAGRLLAPYVGVSIETFTSIIGTILAGIAVGAWIGGALADRVDPRRLLPVLLMLGGAMAIVTIPVVRVLGELGDGDRGSAAARSLFLTSFAFFPVAMTLSAVPPAVVKLQLRDLAATGSTVGRLSAWGTAGALVGTFVTGFVLVAAAAVTTLIVGVGLLLIAGGVVMWLYSPKRRSLEFWGSTGVALAALVGVVAIDSPCDTRTAYYCVSVIEDPFRASGRMLVLDDLRHSYVDLDDPTRLEFWYVRRLVDVIDLAAGEAGRPVDVAYLGGGGFTIPRYVRAVRPGSEQVVLEIDGDLVDVNEDELGFEMGDDIDVRVGDGRMTIRDLDADSFAVVAGDAFGGRTVPFHLTTQEFVEDVARVLVPDGYYAVNVIDGPDERFLRAMAATVASVFDHVAVIRGPTAISGVGGNSVVVASGVPLDQDALSRLVAVDVDPTDGPLGATAGEVLAGPELEEFLRGAQILTDDFAPADQLQSLET